MAEFLARRPQIRPDPWNQRIGTHGPALKRGQPFVTAPGIALPTSTFPILPGYVRFTTLEGPLRSIDLLTTGEPFMLPEGYAAGWESVSRRGRVDRLKWTGGKGLRQAVPVKLDVLRWRGFDIVEAWKALRHMARPPRAARPPALRIAGPVEHDELDWVIVGFDPDPGSTKRRGRRMVRQDVMITLGQWSEVEAQDALRRTKPAKDKPRQIVAKAGDTLKKIAKRELNDGSRWTEVRDLNKGLHDPNRAIPAGTQISIPPR